MKEKDLQITVKQGRNFAYTSKSRSVFCMHLGKEKREENGFFVVRGGVKHLVFNTFRINGKEMEDAERVVISPYGFEVPGKNRFYASLLLHEDAFFISSSSVFSLCGISKDFLHANEKKEEHGVKQIVFENGAALCADKPFSFARLNGAELSITPLSKDEETHFYLAFEKDIKEGEKRLAHLNESAAYSAHEKEIDEFFGACNVDFADLSIKKALSYSRFYSWSLSVASNGEAGLWAGLPWFTDSWGRDIFISLTGALLTTGKFDEALQVLTSFASHQDTDEKSKTYGRIPNRYRCENDVIYNTADGTLWFIRSLYEYVNYTGDEKVFASLGKVIFRALEGEERHTSEEGFLLHEDADTWMDARVDGKEAYSPRGECAVEIQSLWFLALRIGFYAASFLGDEEKKSHYAFLAEKVKKSFLRSFVDPFSLTLADHLIKTPYSTWQQDKKVRPNALLAVFITNILPEGEENSLISRDSARRIMEEVERELYTPQGLMTLSPADLVFHSHHETSSLYHKDAAYHNGTIWPWLSGAYISVKNRVLHEMDRKVSYLILNSVKLLLDGKCAASLPENIHAFPGKNGEPLLSGTYMQLWSLAEFNRIISEDVAGFIPRLAVGELIFRPNFPSSSVQANLPFGDGSLLCVNSSLKNGKRETSLVWRSSKNDEKRFASGLIFNKTKKIFPNEKKIFTTEEEKTLFALSYRGKYEGDFCAHAKEYPWVLAGKEKDFLKNLAIQGSLNRYHESGAGYFERLPFFERLDKTYEESDEVKFGAECTEKESIFRLFAPTATKVTLLLGKNGKENAFEMERCEKFQGMWHLTLHGNFHASFYRYELIVEGKKIYSVDGAAKSFSANGKKSALINFSTLPSVSPSTSLENPAQAVIYEVHIRDLTSSSFWSGPEKLKATYLGAAERGTTYKSLPTAFDYIKRLGVTHVQLLPCADFSSVDEERINEDEYKNRATNGAFNWGYDSENFFSPEGSYSLHPNDPTSRVKEIKTLIDSFNREGIGVVMDVVFNHVYDAAKNALNIAAPGYFIRASSLSGAGADVASERFMVRKFIVSCLEFWLSEYSLSGFRFDLMGLLDVKTINEAARRLRAIKNDVLLYGEGWCMAKNEFIAADMKHATSLNEIGFFNDAFRCAVKGSVFSDFEKGFVHDGRNRESIKFGIVGATNHPDVNYKQITGTACPVPWSTHPWRSVNYTEVHDNLTLYAKLVLAEEGKSEKYYERMAIFAISLVLLSEGTAVLHAGMEFLRSKEVEGSLKKENFNDAAYTKDRRRIFLRNTYNVTDRINALNWKRMSEKAHVVEYIRRLIKIKKEHPAFSVRESETLSRILKFIKCENEKENSLLVWRIDGRKVKDTWRDILLAASPKEDEAIFALPEGKWHLVCDGSSFYEDKILTGEIKLSPKTLSIFAKKE